MTPKKKAQELFDKMFDCGMLQVSEAEECAKIAVEEVIKILETLEANTDYWQKVKKEIERL